MADDIKTEKKPTTWNMTVYANDTWPRWAAEVKDGAGNPIDLSTTVIKTQVKDSTGTVIKTITTTDSSYVISGAGNNIFTPSTTVSLTPTYSVKSKIVGKNNATEIIRVAAAYTYDTELVYADGTKETKFKGTIDVEGDVTT